MAKILRVSTGSSAHVTAARQQQRFVTQTAQPQTGVVAAGIMGRPGRNGVGAGGISYIQDTVPVGAVESETWYNPLTLQLKVFHDGAFEPVSPDGGYF